MNKFQQINLELNSPEYKKEWGRFQTMKKCLLHSLLFSYHDSARDGISDKNNFFLRMVDDIMQSVISIEIIAEQGIINTCKRELRYLIELSLKAFFIVNKTSKETFEEQIKEYESILNSSNINPINSLKFRYYNDANDAEFKTKVKKTYGLLSKYTHSTSEQIQERLERANQGKTIGFEGVSELSQLNDVIEEVFSYVIVFVFHSVADYVAGDYLVESNGEINKWYFNRSKYISIIDESFDYKSERNGKLDKLKHERESNIAKSAKKVT